MSELSKVRIISKHDTTENWNKATNFIPREGELILYTDVKKIKMGDGTHTASQLDFTAIDGEEYTANEIETLWNGTTV